jgi:hypothetical protein
VSELDAGAEAPERRGEEQRRRAVRLVTSLRPSPPRTGRSTTLSNIGTPRPAHTEPHQRRHTLADSQKDTWGYTTGGITQTRGLTKRHAGGAPLRGDTSRRTHEKTTGRLTRTHIHRQIHTDTQAQADAQPSVHTPGRFEVQICAQEKKQPLDARGGGAL